jgi:hypothetical protein
VLPCECRAEKVEQQKQEVPNVSENQNKELSLDDMERGRNTFLKCTWTIIGIAVL